MNDPKRLRRVARECRMMLDSATAHMHAVGPIKHLNAYLYAAKVWAWSELIGEDLPEDSDEYVQFTALYTEAVAICNSFEKQFKVFSVETESGKELTIAPVLEKAVQVSSNGETRPVSFENVVRRMLQTPAQSTAQHQAKKVDKRTAGHRLEQHERVEIWNHFNGTNPARKSWKEYTALSEMYNVTIPTVAHWAENNPGRDVKSM